MLGFFSELIQIHLHLLLFANIPSKIAGSLFYIYEYDLIVPLVTLFAANHTLMILKV
jgi:hypothetical protein